MAKLGIQPLGDRILVKKAKAAESKGGILLPESAQEKPREGEVLATGPGTYNDEGHLISMDVKVGDQVLYGSYAGTEVQTDQRDEEYLILSLEDILGVLVKN